jgi:hypothetical protein
MATVSMSGQRQAERHSNAAWDALALGRSGRLLGRPRANAISERWVKSVCAECVDHLFIFNEAGLRRVMASYVRAIRQCSGASRRLACSMTDGIFAPFRITYA